MKRPQNYILIEFFLSMMFFLLGIYTVFYFNTADFRFVYIYGLAFIIFGTAEIIYFIMMAEREDCRGPGFALILGTLNVPMGILMFSNIQAGLMILTMLAPFWMVFHCISRLCSLDFTRIHAGNSTFIFSLIMNTIWLVAGSLLMFFPYTPLYIMCYVIGAYLLLTGVEMGLLALKDHQMEGRSKITCS